MDKVFVIEQMLAPGIWELFSDTFYTDEREANADCLSFVKDIKRLANKDITVRVTTLTNIKNKSHDR